MSAHAYAMDWMKIVDLIGNLATIVMCISVIVLVQEMRKQNKED